MCPINSVLMSCKVKKQEFSGYLIVKYNAKTLENHLKIVFIIILLVFKHRNHLWSFVVTRVYFQTKTMLMLCYVILSILLLIYN